MRSAEKIITPGFHHGAIRSYFNQNINTDKILAELIDNSIDANAKKIFIQVNDDSLDVVDDGDGVSNVSDMFTIGQTGRNSDPSAIGQFGVGAKHALLAIGHVTGVCTRRPDGTFIECEADWLAMSKGGFRPVPVKHAQNVKGLSADNMYWMTREDYWNTVITVRARHKRRLVSKWESLAKSMAIRYRPALLDGIKITLRVIEGSKERTFPLHIEQYGNPPLTDVVTKTVSVNGKSLEIYAGRADDVTPKMTGRALISYGPRVIESPGMLVNNCLHKQMFCAVTLSKDWRLSLATNKDKVQEDREELLEAIWEVVGPLNDELNRMERELIMTLQLQKIGEEIERRLEKLNEHGDQDFAPGDSNVANVPDDEGGDGKGRRGIRQKKDVVPGENKIAEAEYKAPLKVDFKVRTIADSDTLVEVRCTADCNEVAIVVTANVGDERVAKAMDSKGHGLMIMVATSLAQYWTSAEGRDTAYALFGRHLPDEAQDSHTRFGQMALLLIGLLSPPDDVEVAV